MEEGEEEGSGEMGGYRRMKGRRALEGRRGLEGRRMLEGRRGMEGRRGLQGRRGLEGQAAQNKIGDTEQGGNSIELGHFWGHFCTNELGTDSSKNGPETKEYRTSKIGSLCTYPFQMSL